MDLEKKLEELRPYQLNCNVFSVYDYPEETITQLLSRFFQKINECVDLSNKTIDLAKWLVNEGLNQEVAKKLDVWLNDGTLENIINVELFGTLNTKVDENTNEIEKVKGYIHSHVDMFGADPTGTRTCTTEIQKCIDYVKSKGGGIVQFGKGTYKLDKPLFLPSYVTLQGEGMQDATIIYRKPSGARILDKTLDYKTLSREDYLQYDASICVEGEGVYWAIKDIELRTEVTNRVQWGILAPWCALFTIERVQTGNFWEHFRIFNAWNTNWNSVRCINGGYGIRLQHADESFIDTACTSWAMNRVFCEYVLYGYVFVGLQYSSLNAICADQITNRAYTFSYCYGISINGMGCENSNGQLIKNKMSQLSIQGAFFLGMKGGTFPSDAISNSLIEIDTPGRAWCGIHMTESFFKNNNSGKKLLFISRDGNFSGVDIRVNDGTQLGDMEEGSVGGFSEDNVWNLELKNKNLKIGNMRVDKMQNGYAKNTFVFYPNLVLYNDVDNGVAKSQLIIPKSEIGKNFTWVNTTDNFIWIPLKISVTSDFNGSCNHIWNAHNSIISTNKIVLNTEIVQSISTDSTNLIINFTEAKSRLKVVITPA